MRERLCCLTSTEARRPVRDGNEWEKGDRRVKPRNICRDKNVFLCRDKRRVLSRQTGVCDTSKVKSATPVR